MFDNFGYIIERKREIHPKRVALIIHSTNRSYTYEELDALSNKTAQGLLALGARKGDRAMSVMENSVEFFALLFGCNKIGVILVPTNFRLSPLEVGLIGEDVAPKVVVYHASYSDRVEPLRARFGGATQFISVTGGVEEADISFDKFIEQHLDRSPGIHASGADTNVILYTSGSTGKPRGVMQTHLNTFMKSVDQVVDLQPSPSDLLLTMAPVFHVGGLNILTMSMFHVGGSIVLLNRFNPEQALRIIENRKVTLLFAIPTMLKMMVAHQEWEKCSVSSLRYVVSGGEPVPQKIKDKFAAKDIPILAAYGLTEGSSMSAFLREFDNLAKSAECIGKPPTHLESRIVNELNSEVGIREIGELIQRGPTITSGYWNNLGDTKEKIRNGWLHTGDLAYKDEEGFYYLVGRRDDMINTGGEKVYPSEVEEAIYTNPQISEVTVIGRPDEKWGQVVLAIVVIKAGSRLEERELIEYCKERISGYKCPRKVVMVGELPHTGSGKVDRKRVKEIYGSVS